LFIKEKGKRKRMRTMIMFFLLFALLCGVSSVPIKSETIIKEIPFSILYQENIVLFDGYDYVSVVCDNCFVQAKGELMLHVEFSSYTVTLLELGFKNVTISMGVGVTVSNSYFWAFNWERTIRVGSIEIFSFPPISLWTDLDILFKFGAMAKLEAPISFGDNVIMKLEDMYLVFTHTRNETSIKVKEKIYTNVVPYLKMRGFGKEKNTFTVRPSLNFHLSEIFEMSLFASPIIKMNAYNVLKRKICCAGEYEFDVCIAGKVVGHTFEKNLFYEDKKIPEVCYEK
jgi:hypothetical protein